MALGVDAAMRVAEILMSLLDDIGNASSSPCAVSASSSLIVSTSGV